MLCLCSLVHEMKWNQSQQFGIFIFSLWRQGASSSRQSGPTSFQVNSAQLTNHSPSWGHVMLRWPITVLYEVMWCLDGQSQSSVMSCDLVFSWPIKINVDVTISFHTTIKNICCIFSIVKIISYDCNKA